MKPQPDAKEISPATVIFLILLEFVPSFVKGNYHGLGLQNLSQNPFPVKNKLLSGSKF